MLKKILKIVLIIVLALVIAFGVFLAVLTLTEYKPEAEESITVNGSASQTLAEGDSFVVTTWNIGYGGLDADEDFFMDGGSKVLAKSKEQVQTNMSAITSYLQESDSDILLLQEVDLKSKRSYKVNEATLLQEALPDYENTFAYNYKTLYVPYPWPTLGKVQAGLLTFSDYSVTDATRVSLPCPFSYPLRLCNLKRCLLVNRIPIENSDKELVIVNLHLEAYDDGEGKAAQTEQLRELLQQEYDKGNYVIAGGDFNQSFSNVDTSMYPLISEEGWACGQLDASEFSSDWQLVQDNLQPSCRSLETMYTGADPDSFQYYLIDGFIVSDNIQIDNLATVNLNFANSDHNPVRLEVTLK